MKSIAQLIEDLEKIGVFEYKHDSYYATGYHIDITNMFVDLHKQLKRIEQLEATKSKKYTHTYRFPILKVGNDENELDN